MIFTLRDTMGLAASAGLEEEPESLEGFSLCRLTADWSRVEPADGVFDEAVLSACRERIQGLRERGVCPVLVLHRRGLPAWLEERGGFASGGGVTCYLRYAHRMVEALGDLASSYITFDEPNCLALAAYLPGGEGKRSLLAAARSMTNLTAAHIEAYGLIRKTRLAMGFTDTRVGVSPQLRVFAPKNPQDPVHRFWASRSRQIFQASLIRAMYTGRASFPIGGHPSIVPGRYCDFHAINYYARSTVSALAGGRTDGPVNDLGWEIYPQGIVETAQRVYSLLPRPIYITENGTCDNTDRFRARYIAEHLQAICESELPIERYYHWCFCDNWEWLEGNSARFGLVHVDYETQARTVKSSGEFYRQVIAQGGVSDELYSRFCDVPYPTGREDA